MNDITISPLDPLGGPEPVRPTDRGSRLAHAPEREPRQPIPGLDSFDRLELSGGAAVQQAYAKFTVHPTTGVVSIKIIDARTDEIIREIPADDVLRIAEELEAYIKIGRPRRS